MRTSSRAESEREGYAPVVVYTCGALVRGDQLIMRYGFSDAGISVAQVRMSELLEALLMSQRSKPHSSTPPANEANSQR